MGLINSIGNISKMLTPLTLTYIRFDDPFLKGKKVQLWKTLQ